MGGGEVCKPGLRSRRITGDWARLRRKSQSLLMPLGGGKICTFPDSERKGIFGFGQGAIFSKDHFVLLTRGYSTKTRTPRASIKSIKAYANHHGKVRRVV